MKKLANSSKLQLNRETLRRLNRETLRRLDGEDTPKVAGGYVCTYEDTTCNSCYTGCRYCLP